MGCIIVEMKDEGLPLDDYDCTDISCDRCKYHYGDYSYNANRVAAPRHDAHCKKSDNNQSIKEDDGKPELSLVPWQIAYDIAECRSYGVLKYGDSESWREVELSRYINAMLRHTLAFVRDNNGKDEESGIEHYKHAACNLAFICELMKGERKNESTS